jgi:thymidylate synthase (FAD)
MELNLCIVKPAVRLITPEAWLPEMAKIIETAGRLSHKSEDKMTEDSAHDFIHRIAFGLGHESIVEHCCITALARMSRAASHQWVRHRIAAYTQESQRYCDYSHPKFGKTLEVICPPSIMPDLPSGSLIQAELTPGPEHPVEDHDNYTYRLLVPDPSATNPDEAYKDFNFTGTNEKFRRWAFAVLRAYGRYVWLREEGVKAEDARFILPNAAKTEIAVTFNIRMWRHFFTMRCTKHAQWEIRGLAKELLRMFIDKAPWGFADDKMLALAE